MPNLRATLEHHLARTAATVLLVVSTLTGCATVSLPSQAPEDMASEAAPSPEKRIERLDKNAVHAAVADGISTSLALSAGAMEMNPLISTSPIGLVALTGAKIGLVKFAGRLPEPQKRLVIKASSAVWGGAAVNNLMVLMSAPSPVAVAAGVVAGVLWWRHSNRVYQQADREIAARQQKLPLPLDAERPEVAAVTQAPPALAAQVQ
ncbi:hypothetical protein [Massilia niabensis]|uniref:DUF4126 domain-containing protein n=1 Tax=Massilia niabensis TaxID=544910 RepID=A0ABW0KZB3_9BURK